MSDERVTRPSWSMKGRSLEYFRLAEVYTDQSDRDIKAQRKCERYWRHLTWLYRKILRCERGQSGRASVRVDDRDKSIDRWGTVGGGQELQEKVAKIAEQAETIARLWEFIETADYDDYWVERGGSEKIATALKGAEGHE